MFLRSSSTANALAAFRQYRSSQSVLNRITMNHHCGRFTGIATINMMKTTTTTTTKTLRYFHATPMAFDKMNLAQLAEKVNLHNQKVLVRVDLNVPLDKNDETTITDDTRLRAMVPTVQFLLNQNAAVILCSHFGRPKGQIIERGKHGRLNCVVQPLSQLLNVPIIKVNDCIGPEVELAAQNLQGGQILLLENTRFHLGETRNDEKLSEGLGKLAEYYVNDAFGTAHRAHSSTEGVTKYMKYSVAGLLMERELKFLITAMEHEPVRPVVAIVGGAKVSTKIPAIESLIEKCDTILIGGGMMFTFYKALGYDIGASLLEADMEDMARNLMIWAEKMGVKLLLPTDVVLADAMDNDANTAIAKCTEISGQWRGLDIGPETIDMFGAEIAKAGTVIWNGPMGVFEMSNFAAGTKAMAQHLANATANNNCITIVGGGDSVAAINQAGLGDQVSHISTGGGATLELLEGKVLPGVAALTDAYKC